MEIDDAVTCAADEKLFGSVARNQITPLSDIDLAILYKKGLDKKEIECIESEIYPTVSSYLETDEIDFINPNAYAVCSIF